MIVFPEQFADYQKEIGSKTRNLKVLADAGFNVPPFVAIPASIVEKLVDSDGIVVAKELSGLTADIKKSFVCDKYAVRSSALIEDAKEHSFAGQFRTEIEVSPENLERAISNVLKHAFGFLKGEIRQFSIVVQKYITADYAGICFTRSPGGGREMVLEYHRGIGEDVVSGKVTPQKINCYWNQCVLSSNLPNFKGNLEKFKKIELLFDSPQDVEWCIKSGQWYFLQTRPITTVTDAQYRENLFLDEALPKDKKFFFEKTEISEIAPRPTPFTLSLLNKIYEKGGPIERVYAKYGVRYAAADFLKIIGNELFVDRELEIKGLMPSFSYLTGADFKLHFASLSGFWRTMRNLFYLNKIPLNKHEELLSGARKALEQDKSQENLGFKETLHKFIEDYELIFEINLLAQKAIGKLESALKKEPISAAAILSESVNLNVDFDGKNLIGNCLEIADESVFIWGKPRFPPRARLATLGLAPLPSFRSAWEPTRPKPRLFFETDEGARNWFSSLPNWKKQYFLPIVNSAREFNRLRECGRYLTVRNVNSLRKAAFGEAKKANLTDKRLIYSATIPEILRRSISQEICESRKAEYSKYEKYRFPSVLTSDYVVFGGKTTGVSAGKATGQLVDLSDPTKLSGNILYTKILSPDLTQYFGKIKGIVSESGGLLSHLAIVARESKMPIVVNFDIKNSSIQFGDFVEINGSTGEIKKMAKVPKVV